MPPGVPYIVGNELAERFSFYGMKGILVIFMTRYLLDATGKPDFMSAEEARGVYHLFTASAYFFPLIGAVIADVFLGKYKTILFISLMYCFGHGALALMDLGPHFGSWDMKPFLYIGLFMIAIGSGGIKPCVSAHVGDQFGQKNQHLITKVFNWFYFSINLGAAAASFLIPILLEVYGPWAAFGLPGVLMAVATFLFWLGRNSFIHIPAAGWEKFIAETFSPEGKQALMNLAPLFLIFVPVFWAIFDQTGSAWVLQSESMNRNFMGIYWLESQVQMVNPVLILTLIPIFTYIVYPFMAKFFEPTPLRKIGIGFVFTAAAFGLSALIEQSIDDHSPAVISSIQADLNSRVESGDINQIPLAASAVLKGDYKDKASVADALSSMDSAGLASVNNLKSDLRDSMSSIAANPPKKLSVLIKKLRDSKFDQAIIKEYVSPMPNIGWQFLAYLLLTAGEVLVSIVCLEFAYTQSPRKMKSFVMGVFMMGISFANFSVAGVNFMMEAMKRPDGSTPLDGPSYYWFFSGLMMFTLVVYIFFAKNYKGETYIQGNKTAS